MTALPDFGIAGRTVLVTGASGGIGGAFVDAFAAGGAMVIASDLRSPEREFADGVRFLPLDVRDRAAVARLADEIETLDVVIHCAGRITDQAADRLDEFDALLELHLSSAFRLAGGLRPRLAASRGSIILIASMYAFAGHPRGPGYGAAKAGIVSLTKSLALAYAGDGIRVNASAPGWIDTELSKAGQADPDFNARVMARLPIGRWAMPEELAGTAVFLASPAAALISGVTIPVDGGYLAT